MIIFIILGCIALFWAILIGLGCFIAHVQKKQKEQENRRTIIVGTRKDSPPQKGAFLVECSECKAEIWVKPYNPKHKIVCWKCAEKLARNDEI